MPKNPDASPEHLRTFAKFFALAGDGEYALAHSWLAEARRHFERSMDGVGAWAGYLEALEDMLSCIQNRERLLEDAVERLDESHTELRAIESQLKKENAKLKQQLRKNINLTRIIGASPKMAKLVRLAQRVADTTVNVLITGETGTGKELVAKLIHFSGQRRQGPFMAVNCTAVPDSLFESEFFGIGKGVATGVEKRRGLFEAANGGTLFLDEIGDMAEASQAKILRVLELGEVSPVGSRETLPVDIRLVSATNRDLKKDIEDGRFRRDLYYRIKVVSLDLPPLRDRRDDIPLLAENFLLAFARNMGRGKMSFSKAARDALQAYDWPGNIRELENEVERAVALAYANVIDAEDLSREVRKATRHAQSRAFPAPAEPGGPAPAQQQGGRLRRMEREAIDACLKECGGNRTRAAKMLGISRESLRRKLKEPQEQPEEGGETS